MARVVLEHLTKVFRASEGHSICAVDDLCLTVEDKELLVLVGPSGCGKTTTLRLIAGLEEPTEGSISMDGQVVNEFDPKDRDIAMVFQNYALYPHMSVYENMAFGLMVRKCPKSEIQQRLREAAQLLELGGCLERKPNELSGGQRQRAALGRAIVREPRLFLLDEPLSNLDSPMRLQMRAEIARLHQRLASTMIYVTHDQTEAMTLGNRIAVMKNGVLQQVADPMTLYQRPANMFVAGFIGSPPMNFFRGTLVEKGTALFFHESASNGEISPNAMRLRLDDQAAAGLTGSVSRQVVLGLRAEDITDRRYAGDAPADQIAEVLTQVVMPLGPETHLQVASATHSFIARVPASARVGVNEKIPLAFGMRHAHFFDPQTQHRIN